MAAPIKVGLNIVWVQPQHLVEFAQTAEALGYESLWSGEQSVSRLGLTGGRSSRRGSAGRRFHRGHGPVHA